jgi:hypothetical protein
MMLQRVFLVAVLTVLLISCDQDRNFAAVGPEADKAVIAVVLKDFANWKEVTFGELDGVLVLEPDSEANPDATPEDIRSLASEISEELDDEVVATFIVRNRSAAPVTSLFAGLPWARLQQPAAKEATFSFVPPDGAKAVGSLTLPGFSKDGSQALVQIHHSWSMHGAVVTYLLSKKNDTWQVVARDQAVFL